jgi:hypothetical protein
MIVSKCATCGFEWLTGAGAGDGWHSCGEVLQQSFKAMQIEAKNKKRLKAGFTDPMLLSADDVTALKLVRDQYRAAGGLLSMPEKRLSGEMYFVAADALDQVIERGRYPIIYGGWTTTDRHVSEATSGWCWVSLNYRTRVAYFTDHKCFKPSPESKEFYVNADISAVMPWPTPAYPAWLR